MWARDFEIALGLWLVLSPFVFRVPGTESAVWAVDLAAGSVVVTLALLAYWKPLRRIHLLELLPALALVVLGWLATRGPQDPPHHQNHILVGLLLAMFAILPSRAARPPRAWRDFGREHDRSS